MIRGGLAAAEAAPADSVPAPAGMPVTDPALAATGLRAELEDAQVRLLFAQTGQAAITHVALAALTAVVLWPHAPRILLVAWSGLLLLTVFGRLVTRARCSAANAEARRGLFALHAVCIVAGGLVWGVGCAILGRPLSFEMNLFLTFIMAGLTAGAIATLGAHHRLYVGFFAAIALPVLADFLLRGSELYSVMALMIAVYFLPLQAAARSYEHHLQSALRLDRANARLVATLKDSNHALLASNERLSYQAGHDELTGLFNRREFERRVAAAIEGSAADGAGHAVCYLDLDQFKIVNDTCGHPAGDELLRQVAQILKQSVRRSDTLARLGGDEFAVLMERCTVEQARRAANAIRGMLAPFCFSWEDRRYKVGASIGLVPIDRPTQTVASVLSAADAACFTAKEQGRDRVHVYHPSDQDIARHRGEMAWVERIDRAIDENRLSLAYQVIAPADPAARCGLHFELLVRLEDDDGRQIAPSVFLPAAERFHVASRIDRWVVRTALAWLRGLGTRSRDIELCSINLSGQSLTNPDFLDFTLAELALPGTSPARVCFEITETAAIRNLAAARRFIREVRARGCRIALDDFGSGLSSFGYLRSLEVDFLKIDGMFVKDLLDDPINLAMVRSINEIGKVLGKRTVAEFVEDEPTRAKLVDIGVDYVQGYGIGRPRALRELFADG